MECISDANLELGCLHSAVLAANIHFVLPDQRRRGYLHIASSTGKNGPQPDHRTNGGTAENANDDVFEHLFRVETLEKEGISCLVLHTPPPHTELRAQKPQQTDGCAL